MATYRFPRILTLVAWEAELRHGSYAAEQAWSEADPADRLNLDFSRVEFADFGALARALLLLDAAVKRGIPATVALPTTSVLPPSEPAGAWPTLAERRARARGDALVFMRQAGFIDSLRAPHWGANVSILDQATAGSRESGSSPGLPESDPHNDPYQPRLVFPFRWLEPMPAAQLRESESFVTVSTGLEDLGLSSSDARTLSQTVLTELVETVAEHGGDRDRPPVALVGAILLTAEAYAARLSGMHGHMAEVAERALADDSHVLRLIVADSGADFAAQLAPAPGQRGVETGSIPDRRREAILTALGKQPATTAAGTSGRRGTPGLWWVARVVRSYHGGVQARTADVLVGLLFGQESGGTGVMEEGFSYVPGRLLELTLPTGPSPPRPRPPWGSLSVPGTAPRLEWVNCFFDPERGLADADRTRLAERIRASHTGIQAGGLIVTVPLHDAGHAEIDNRWRGAIHQLLDYVSSIARWGPVVVAFPDAEPHILDPCVAAFNEEVATTWDEDAQDPILVVGRTGEPSWCGGSVPLRAVLNLLSENEGSADLATVGERWQQSGGEPGGLSGTLHANGHLLSIGTNRLELRLSLAAVHGTVVQAVSQHLAEVISKGGKGVELGTFRGPTLHLVNRWISADGLLAGTIGVSLAAFVLARRVELALRTSARGERPTRIIQVRSAPRALGRHVSECLTLGGRYYTQQSELNIGEPPMDEKVPVGAKVVLCTDVICTENTVRRAVAMIAGYDADPLVIACVVDMRDTRGPVRLLDRIIPVVSLAEVKVGFSGSADERVTDIDPLTLRPEVPAFTEAAPAQEEDLLEWFAAPDALRLGHIDDPPHRHYSAFIPLQAMHQRTRRDQITDAVLSNVKHALADIRAQGGLDPVTEIPFAIWYVPADGNAERLAEIVHDCLAAEGFQVSALTPVPRWIAGDAWAFPTSLSDLTRPLGVLIIHWWAITGSTLLQLARLAAKSGASWIAAVCVLNQLGDANDADALRMLRAVSVPADADSSWPPCDPSRASHVPVAIRFVARSSITAFDAHGCPMCTIRERYRLDDDAAPPRLIHHAGQLRDMLRPRLLEEVAPYSAADLFTVPVTGYEVADYLRWRGLLMRAPRTVSLRQQVIVRLEVLTKDLPPEEEWTSVGLIRLLAAEQQWLRLPPLYFQAATDLLSQVCVNSFEQLTAPLWLRVQALMVMSAAVPQHLVEMLPSLLRSAGNEPVLIDQMLLDCRLLLRAPGHSHIDVHRLRRSLVECREYLEEQRSEPDPALEDHLHSVRNLLTIADYRILSKPQTPQAAWERLSEDLVHPVIRHRLEADLLLVRSFVEDIERVEPTPESARAAEADWDICARQLEERALGNLAPLREILAGDFVSDRLGSRDQRRLLTLARPDAGELRAVTDRLHTLAHRPWRPTDPSWRAVRRQLLDRINWWNRIFLAAHQTDNELPALLVELINSAPSKPGTCVTRLLDSHRAKATISGTEYEQTDVFCPEKLLDQIIAHLLENLDKHGVPGATRRLHIEYKPPDQDTMQMVVHNSGTVGRTPPGRGLMALNDKLRPFGGSLTYQMLTEGDWTFAAVVALPLWHGSERGPDTRTGSG
jgi:adenine/guanine phosphoribosyltransferase-like PRPP-binding protein